MRIVVAEDAAIVREGLVGLLRRQGHEVIGEVGSAPGLLEALAALGEGQMPDLVITDVRMPPGMGDDGLRAAVNIRKKWPQISLLVFSQFVSPTYTRELFSLPQSFPPVSLGRKGGGLGYLLKDRVVRVADFMESLAVIAGGGMVVDPQVASQLMSTKASVLQFLTPRESQVLELMARGLSNAQIQEKLVLSPAAVSKHVANVFMKLGLGPEEENRRVRAVLCYLTQNINGDQLPTLP